MKKLSKRLQKLVTDKQAGGCNITFNVNSVDKDGSFIVGVNFVLFGKPIGTNKQDSFVPTINQLTVVGKGTTHKEAQEAALTSALELLGA